MGPHGAGVFFGIDLRSTKLKHSAPRVELSEIGGRGSVLGWNFGYEGFWFEYCVGWSWEVICGFFVNLNGSIL